MRNSFSRQRGGALKVVLLVLAGIVLLVLIVAVPILVWLRQVVDVDVSQTPGAERVSISTPMGEFKVEKAEDAARHVQLPIYPGAVATQESISMRMRVGVDHAPKGFDLTVAKFRTSDSLDTVDDWYRRQLSSDFIREKGKVIDRDPAGEHDKWVVPKVEKGRGDGVVCSRVEGRRVRGVALERRGTGTQIAFFDVAEAEPQ